MFSTPLLFSFSSEASNFNRNNRGVEVKYQRYDLFPTISYPFKGWPFLTFRTTLSGRYTYYTAIKDSSGINDEENVDRRYYEVRFDMRGPTFARIFNTPDNFYADRYKHVVEPQIVWTYRSRVDTFDDVPKFDSEDYVPGTNQFSLSLVNRLFAKREKQGGGKSAPVEFLTWVLSQRYFFDINASLYDRQFSTPYFTPDGKRSNYSPITSKLRFRPGPSFSASWNLEYDINFHQMRMVSITGTYLSRGRGSFRGMWSRRNLVQSNRVRNNLRGIANFKLTDRIGTNFDVAYDIVEKQMTQIRAGATYDVQCCGFMFEFARYQYGILRNENLFRFNVTLANIGSFGTFLGGGQGARY
jgi:LPS-assembly protein